MNDTRLAGIPATVERKPDKEKGAPAAATGQRIWQAIVDLHSAEQAITREVLVEATGYKMTIIDDHVTRMVECGRLRRVRAGLFVPIPQYEPPRPVYGSMTTDGFFVLEVGDQKVVMQPREARQAGALMAGQFMQLTSIQANHDLNQLVSELHEGLKAVRRDIGR
ncbi:hypothetical protein [Paracidovorax konjaci]|uniref:Uncharacterized protein n=1 Tax=Paracidovorax konjaci TaxID=32040 RepID=A0A1I1YIC6_9BURK|nr:hypothetical protein [Paracidovorax konjaci]SFE19307.1 hypothetical protein SAMN04489710_11830 [Paracidovorax konjaci]